MGTIRKVKSGWKYQVRVAGDKRRSKTFKFDHTRAGKRLAIQAGADWEVSLDRTGARTQKGDVTVSQIVEDWFRLKSPGWAPITAANARHRLDKHVLPIFGERIASSVTAEEVTAWLEGLGFAQRTLVLYANTLSGPFSHAEKMGRLVYNPVRGARPPMPRGERTPAPSTAVLKRALADAWTHDSVPHLRGQKGHCLLTVAMTCGMRRAELGALHWDNVDSESIVVVQNISDGKLTRTKSLSRRIALDEHTSRVLRDWREACDHGGFVFSRSPTGDEFLKVQAVSVWWGQLRSDDSVRFHDIRHWAASHMLSAGIDVYTVSRRLGNDPATLLRTYAHLIPARDQEAARILGDLLDG